MAPRQQPRRARLSPEAEEDLKQILEWSEEHFGQNAALRYAELIIQALHDLEADPLRPGARKPEQLPPNVYIYHLAASRDRVAGGRVKSPRHFILYRQHKDDVLEVLRILHDSRDLARHTPSGLDEE